MRIAYADEDARKLSFAKEAAARFADDAKAQTYTEGDIEEGALFALRASNAAVGDSVIVFEISEMEPVMYRCMVSEHGKEGA